jgi:hypothetical protein
MALAVGPSSLFRARVQVVTKKALVDRAQQQQRRSMLTNFNTPTPTLHMSREYSISGRLPSS